MDVLLLLLAGPLFIVACFALMALRLEPFASFFYLFAWYGLIFTFDQLIRRRRGQSAIVGCGFGFVEVLLWSAGFWYFFELINLRLQDWYYVFVTDVPWLRTVGTFLSFSTVLPGVLLLDHYLAVLGVARHMRGRPLGFGRRGRRWLQAAGVLFLLLSLVAPVYCFALVWLAPIFILAPMRYSPGRDALLNQLERGEYGPLLRTLLAGLIAGVFWELFNYWARAKWIYTVPFFSELRLFEMPVAGFLGFPPFALACVILYRLLVWERLAPPFAGVVTQRSRPRSGRCRAVVWAGVLAFSLAVDLTVVNPRIIASVTPRTSAATGLDPELREALVRAGIEHLTDLEGWRGRRAWLDLARCLTPEQLARVRRITAVYLHQGIGIEYGNLLICAGVHSLCDLASLSPQELHARLRRAAGRGRVPSLRQVQVWVSRARKTASCPGKEIRKSGNTS